MDRLSRKVSFSVLGGKAKVVTLLEVSDKEQGVVALTYKLALLKPVLG